jgi:hypothetical protein
LAGFILTKPLYDDVTDRHNLYALTFQCSAGSGSIDKQKVRNSVVRDNKGSATFNADSCAAQSLSHSGEFTRTIIECDCDVLHPDVPPKKMLYEKQFCRN